MTAHEFIEEYNKLLYYKEFMINPRSQPLEYNIPLEDEIINIIKYYDVTPYIDRASGRRNSVLSLVHQTLFECLVFDSNLYTYYSILVNGGIPVAEYSVQGTLVINVKTKEIELWMNETIAPLYQPDVTRCALNGDKFLDASNRLHFEHMEFWKNYSGDPNEFGQNLQTHMVNNISVFAKLAGSEDYYDFWELCVDLGYYEDVTYSPY